MSVLRYLIFICLPLLLMSAAVPVWPQKSLAVTIYNSDFAMVKDVRSLTFPEGNSKLSFTDVSRNIQPETVTFKAIQRPELVNVYEQNYQANLINTNGILARYIDHDVEIFVRLGELSKRVKGTLLGYSTGYILKTEFGINVFNNIEAIEFPQLPDGFFTLPTLEWMVNSKTGMTTDCEVAYRTTGFSWKADYSITVDSEEKMADVGGWVTIDNHSGKKYVDAKLKLIAGDVNTVQQQQQIPRMAMDGVMLMKTAAPNAPSFSEKSFSDYHMYTLSSVVTLNDNSEKQVEFIPKVYAVPIRKYNEITLNIGGNNEQNVKAVNKFQFNNSADVKLGMPLPKGTVRVFKSDEEDNSLEFIGEDNIDHTPKNENVTITSGNAFDITVNKIATNYVNYNNGGYMADLNLTIANHKDIPTEIVVTLNSYYGSNVVIRWDNKDTPLQKINANKYQFGKVFKANEVVTWLWNENYRI